MNKEFLTILFILTIWLLIILSISLVTNDPCFPQNLILNYNISFKQVTFPHVTIYNIELNGLNFKKTINHWKSRTIKQHTQAKYWIYEFNETSNLGSQKSMGLFCCQSEFIWIITSIFLYNCNNVCGNVGLPLYGFTVFNFILKHLMQI